jgi:polysaccharide biosynthesis/export protein ExoF
LLIVFNRHRTSSVVAGPGRGGALRTSRALRLSMLCLLLLSFAPLGFGVIAGLPSAQFAPGLHGFSDLWTRLVAVVPWHSLQTASAVATTGRAADRSWALVPAPSDSDRGVVWYGDRLKINFFESIGVALNDNKAGADQVAAIFPRMDLSAEYAVDEGGSVNVPRLGAFPATGQTIAALQSALAASFERTIGRTSDVQVAFVERQPIYVLGAVRSSGPFRHVPNMTVLQAFANAGGPDTATADTSRTIENIRETERLHQNESQLDSLLLKRAVLLAQRNNLDALQVPPEIRTRLLKEAPGNGLAALVAGAAATLGVERKRFEQQLSLAERQVDLAQLEREAQTLRADQLKDLLARKQRKLHEMEAVAARGSVSQFKIIDMGVEVSELLVRQEDLRVALAQAERRQVETEAARAKVQTDRSMEVEHALAATQREVDDCRRSIASMRAVTQVLRDALPKAAPGSTEVPNFKITRRVPMGLTVIQADETTSLLPGDVLQVSSANRPDTTISDLTGNAKQFQN